MGGLAGLRATFIFFGKSMVNPCKSLVSAISDNLDAILNFLAEGWNYLLAQGGELLVALELRFGCVVMSWEHLVVWW